MKKLLLVSLLCLAIAPVALAQPWILDPPGKPLKLYSSNSNDGYSASRGVVFTAQSAFTMTSFGYYNNVGNGGLAGVELWEGVNLNGNTGGTMVASGSANVSGPLAWYDVAMNYNLKANTNYEALFRYTYASAENYFYDYDPVLFGDPPFTVGPVKVVDGTQGRNTSNFVMPRFRIIPEPSSLALVGLATLLLRRR